MSPNACLHVLMFVENHRKKCSKKARLSTKFGRKNATKDVTDTKILARATMQAIFSTAMDFWSDSAINF